MKLGIDVSDNQGVINWKNTAKAGVQFVIIRSTRGSGKTDYQFVNNVKGCRDNNIPFDVYKYVYALTEEAAAEEMTLVCKLLRENGIYCTIWYDIEWVKLRALGKAAITKIVKAAEAVAKKYDFPFGIYCNKDWYKNVIDTKAFENEFWVAGYPSKKTISFGTYPNESYKPVITQTLFGWQFASTGSVPGISGAVDMNVLYQDAESKDQTPAANVIKNPYQEPTYTLYLGRLAMSVEYVKWLQYYLVSYGHMAKTYTFGGKTYDSIDGAYGKLTDKAVREFQVAHPETYSTKAPDKRIGPKSRAVLKAGK
ncbi:MAG: GH25 family lysozyme [Lachnospiraceae bacterium]|nr:GH25 family lysozyme [Lachnospiraceae bacterium]